MTLATNALPFGLRQVKLTPIKADGTLDSVNSALLPASRTFSFSEAEAFDELVGDDITIATHGKGPTTTWDLEGGGISLAIWKILAGGSTTASGTSPAASQTFTKLTSDSRPYFQVEGRAISDNGGDFHTTVYRCKANADLTANLSNGNFLLTACKGVGYGNLTDGKLYDFVYNETPVPIVAGV